MSRDTDEHIMYTYVLKLVQILKREHSKIENDRTKNIMVFKNERIYRLFQTKNKNDLRPVDEDVVVFFISLLISLNTYL